MKTIHIGVVGATGIVGETFLQLMNELDINCKSLRLFAGPNSVGKLVPFRNQQIKVEGLSDGCFKGLDLVFFSAGGSVSEEWAPKAVAEGAYAVDNSSAFRMKDGVPLVVPEINAAEIPKNKASLIANPNCSTIQMVVALNPIKQKFGLKWLRVSTYQSVSGAGRDAVKELKEQCMSGKDSNELQPRSLPHPIAFNCIPQIGTIADDGFCIEETKMMDETRKILSLPSLRISAFTVRTPTLNSHAESLWFRLDQSATKAELERVLQDAPGLVYLQEKDYPMQFQTSGRNPVYAGRLHVDPVEEDSWILWVVADNLRKGAALNGLQIAQEIYS